MSDTRVVVSLMSMLEKLSVGKRFIALGVASLCLTTVYTHQPDVSVETDPGVHSPFIVDSGEEFLDQIFVEEKSNRICRFIKVKKMKA